MTHASGRLLEVVFETDCQELAFVVVSNTAINAVRTRQAFAVPLAFVHHHLEQVCLCACLWVNVDAVDVPVDEPVLNFTSFEVQGVWVECTECFPHAVRPILAEAVVVGVNICCTDDAHMIGMCGIAQLVRNDRHSLPVVEGCVQRFCAAGRCIGILAEVECGSVALVKVNEYTALPRAVNAVAITAFHAVRDARITGMPAAGDKRPAVTVLGKVIKNIAHRLPSAHNVVLNPGNNRTRHPCLVLFIRGICDICSRIQSR